MRSYRHLTYEERCQICVLLKRGISHTDIARELGVHRSTISRELQRNSMKTGYYYHWAQAQAEERQKEVGQPITQDDEAVDGLRERSYSGASKEEFSCW